MFHNHHGRNHDAHIFVLFSYLFILSPVITPVITTTTTTTIV